MTTLVVITPASNHYAVYSGKTLVDQFETAYPMERLAVEALQKDPIRMIKEWFSLDPELA
jgi:hypothetical protein